MKNKNKNSISKVSDKNSNSVHKKGKIATYKKSSKPLSNVKIVSDNEIKTTNFSSTTASITFASTEVRGEIAKKIQAEMLKEPTKKAMQRNKKASELLHKVRSS